jgi:hypothetical protein
VRRSPPREVDAFDDDLAGALAAFPDSISVPHRVFAVHALRGSSDGED